MYIRTELPVVIKLDTSLSSPGNSNKRRHVKKSEFLWLLNTISSSSLVKEQVIQLLESVCVT